jgi:hypothetical protein
MSNPCFFTIAEAEEWIASKASFLYWRFTMFFTKFYQFFALSLRIVLSGQGIS